MGAPADGLAIQITMYLIWQRACHRPQNHHTHRETHRALQPRQRGSALPISTLDPAFLTTCRLPAGTDRPAQPAHLQQPHTARAPAGRHSPTGSRGFRPLVRHPPPLEPPSPRTRVPAGSVKATGALKSCSTAACPPHLGPGSAPSRAGRRRRLRPPAAQRRRGRCCTLC